MKLESNFSGLFKGLVDPGEKKSRNKLYVFLVCLLISVFIWFLIALSKESYTSLEYPVQFVNIPADMVLVNEPDSILTFRISSGGFELFTLRYLTPRTPIKVDLGNLIMEKQDGFYTGVYNTSRLSADISRQHRFAEELISISPETLHFRFEPLTGKMVPVVSALDLEFPKQYRLADSIVFSPAKVKVVGPRNLIDRVERVETEARQVVVNEGRTVGSCRVVSPMPGEQLALVPDQVEFAMHAVQFTESKILIEVLPVSDRYFIKTYPQKVEITFLVSLDNFKRVDPELFKAVIDPSSVEEGRSSAPVRLAKAPAFVEVTRIEPPQVDFLLLQK